MDIKCFFFTKQDNSFKAWITGLLLLCLFYWSKKQNLLVGKYFYRHKILFVLMRSREINLSKSQL